MSTARADPLVLVTGATGHMANLLPPALRERYPLRLMDIRPGREDDVQIADLSAVDRSELNDLFDGVGTVLHLGLPALGARHQLRQQRPQIEDFNIEFGKIRMSQNVYRCAHDAGVKRVVVASSNQAADWYEHALVHTGPKDVVTRYEPLADNFYGWSMARYEHLGFLYVTGALGRSLVVVQVRIGAPRDIDVSAYAADEPPAPQPGPDCPTGLARSKCDLSAWLSVRDVQQLFVRRRPLTSERHAGPGWVGA